MKPLALPLVLFAMIGNLCQSTSVSEACGAQCTAEVRCGLREQETLEACAVACRDGIAAAAAEDAACQSALHAEVDCLSDATCAELEAWPAEASATCSAEHAGVPSSCRTE